MSGSLPINRQGLVIGSGLLSAGLMLALASCGSLPKSEADVLQRGAAQQGPAAVDVVIAQAGSLDTRLEYTGTTQPYRSVSLRTQAEGQLLSLAVDVGDRVTQGQVLATLDDKVLATTVAEAQAETAALQSGVAQARTEVSDALAQVERSRIELQQAQADAERYETLARAGAVAQQQAEQARSTARTLQQSLRSAQQVVRTRQQAVTAATKRVTAQQAVTARERERLSYAALTSPIYGVVLEKTAEIGNAVQTGAEILALGDFSQVKVQVQVSELELSSIRVGQVAQVKLDAFPQSQLSGTVTRVSPVADSTARLIPVEVTIPNSQRQLGSGLLARVSFGQTRTAIVAPESVLQLSQGRQNQGGSQRAGTPSSQTRMAESPSPSSSASESSQSQAETLFIVTGTAPQVQVVARRVALGQRQDGKVEVLSGVKPGERLVTRSSKPLQDGAPVRLSIISGGTERRGDRSGSTSSTPANQAVTQTGNRNRTSTSGETQSNTGSVQRVPNP